MEPVIKTSNSVGLDEIIITQELALRPRHEIDTTAECAALHTLARELTGTPQNLLDALIRVALKLCQADTVGVSLLEKTGAGEEIFRWVALGGVYADYVGGTTPRDFSPCGTCLDRGSPQLYSYPERYFTYFQQTRPPIVEGLVVPFTDGAEELGTIWIVSHNEGRKFDQEDERLMTSLAGFTAGALRLLRLQQENRRSKRLVKAETTGRRRALKEKRETEEFNRLLFENRADCVKVLDLDGRIIAMNEQGQRLLEFDEFSAIRNRAWTSFWPGSEDAARQTLETALAGGTGQFHGYCLTAKGTPKWWDVTITPIVDAHGKVVRLLSISRDVTERQKSEMALRESEEQFRLLFEKSADAILIADDAGNYLEANQTACETFGYAQEQLLRMNVAELMTIDAPTAGERYQEYIQKGAEAGEFSFVRPDGERRTLQYNAVRFAPGRHLSILRDITERTRAEAALKRRYRDGIKLTETNRALLGAFEFDQVTEIVCRAARELTGSDGATFVLREGDRVRYVAEDAIAPLWKGQDFPIERCLSGWTMLRDEPAIVADIYADERIPHDVYRRTFVQSLVMMPVGPAIPVASIGVYWARQYQANDYEVELLKSLASAADLALAGVRAYDEARRARTQAEQANRLKDEFLATLSHELRNPLNSIVGSAEILLRSAEVKRDPLAQRAAEIIRRNAGSQAQLINDLLDLSRLHSGKFQLDRRLIIIGPVISDAVEAVRSQAQTRQIELHLRLPDEPLVANADPVRIQQIVWNLLSNAVKFTPNGGRVTLRLRHDEDQVALEIEDNGQGIEAHFLPHVFEMFRQADARITRQYGGLGIGLALVKQLTELYGGSVQARSDGAGRGACFTVRLPLVKAEAAAGGVAHSRCGGLQNARILVVDDSLDSLEMLNVLLRSEGAQVTKAASGDEALNLAQSQDFDLIISDISMPEMDGYELLTRLRADARLSKVPAIALTGFGRPEDVARAEKVGFTSHITKPLDFDRLIELARTAIC